MKKFWWLGLVTVIGISVLIWQWFKQQNRQLFLSPQAPFLVIEKPLEKYSFVNLRQRQFRGREIKLDKMLFFYEVDTDGTGKNIKKVSGQINSPTGEPPAGGWPVVVMLRGYVDHEIYESGVGTRNAAAFFAKQGFVTVAPDFLGYGQSDLPPANTLEDRLLKPVEVMELIASLPSLPKVNPDKIALWGHSNGGQIALSVLEISGKNYPTSLWAPVSKPFPYSILYYTDEFEDLGKALRKVVAGFEAQYNADDYSIHQYYDWINAPIQIHQGTDDDSVPLKWSQALEKTLKEKGKTVKLYVYPGADHNLAGGWDEAAKRDGEWFKLNLE